MKLTTKQIKQIIKEELKAVLEGRTIYAPGPIHKHLLDPDSQYEIDRRDKGGKDKWKRRYEYRPGQRGSNIVYDDETPESLQELHPEIRDLVAQGKLDIAQAMQFQASLGSGDWRDEEAKVEKYFHDAKRVGKTELAVQIEDLKKEIEELEYTLKTTQDKDERMQLQAKIIYNENLLWQLEMVHDKKDPYRHLTLKPYTRINDPRRPVRKDK